MKVLIVDDQEDARMILREGLEASGYTVATACNGQEALQMGRADPPGILITDIMMPVMDGYALCRAWKADVRLSNIPVVFYTATYTDREDKKFAFDLGADAFIAKPTGMDYLLVQLNQVITARKAGKLAARWETPLPETELLREYNQVLVHKLERKLEQLQQAEFDLKRTNRALGVLSKVNHCLVYATDEQGLLSSVCRAIVSQGGYRMAWVGYLEQDKAKTIRVVAKDGLDEGYLESAAIVWADNERGGGPSGMAARTGQTQIAQDFLKDERMSLWRPDAAEHGYASSISLPLIDNKNVFGVLTIYSGDVDAFNAEEIALLEEMSVNLAFGVRSRRGGSDVIASALSPRPG